MSYDMSIIQMPSLRGPQVPCKQQHEEYAVEKVRVQKLAAELGIEAANCHKLHGEYDSAVAKYASTQEANKLCADSLAKWTSAKALYDAYVQDKAACDLYIKHVGLYPGVAQKVKDSNAQLKASWEAAVQKVKNENYGIAQGAAGAAASYAQAADTWRRQKAAFDAYRAAVTAQSNQINAQFTQGMKNYPAYNNYIWPMRTNWCGALTQCVTSSWRAAKKQECDVVRGLGSTTANTCHYWKYYPTCPSTCPGTPTADPGLPPTPPAPPTYKPLPPEPTYKKVPTLQEYLKTQGVKELPGCQNNPVVPKPGSKPGCNPNEPLPVVPPQPTCTPPNIPAMPIEPSCKQGMFAQAGPMWLLLAAGAGALYWYSKKK
jgi:hypothetical protein